MPMLAHDGFVCCKKRHCNSFNTVISEVALTVSSFRYFWYDNSIGI